MTVVTAGPTEEHYMDYKKIKLAGIWTALMLTYLLGDVLRIFSGDFVPGEIDGLRVAQGVWFAAALLMLVPIAMILVSLFVARRVSRWICLAAAVLLFAVNVVGIRSYPSFFDQFLIGVGLLLNLFTVWFVWTWRSDATAE